MVDKFSAGNVIQREHGLELHANGGEVAWRGRPRRRFDRYNLLANAVLKRLICRCRPATSSRSAMPRRLAAGLSSLPVLENAK